MGTTKNGNLWPDGISISADPSIPGLGLLGFGGTYYWNPGAPTAPPVTLTGTIGGGPTVWSAGPGIGAHLVFRRNGMTSADTLGYGTTENVSTLLPSVTVNSSIPDQNYIPQLDKTKVSSIDAGFNTKIGTSAAGTYTWTPQQLAAGVGNLLQYTRPAMGPDDELSPFARTLQSGVGTVGPNIDPPIRFVSSRYQNPLGNGMDGWPASTGDLNAQQPASSAPPPDQPGGLLGMLLDHLRNN